MISNPDTNSDRSSETLLDSTVQLNFIRHDGNRGNVSKDVIAVEAPLTIYINGEELVTLLCTPDNLENLALGFLQSEGLVAKPSEIKKVTIDKGKGRVWIGTTAETKLNQEMLGRRMIPSGCGRGATFYQTIDAMTIPRVTSDFTVQTADLTRLMKEFQRMSHLYRITGGVHSAALCNKEKIICFFEDIARHNAVDKLFGYCLKEKVTTANLILMTSGRVSSEILLKSARRSIPVVASKSAPTSLAIDLAERLGVTIVGFIRGVRLNVYTHTSRVIA
jgi:FdhD protein